MIQKAKLFKLLEKVDIDLDTIDFNDTEQVKNIIVTQHNVTETLAEIIIEVIEMNKKQNDIINQLKGEKGRPKIKPNVPTKRKNGQRKKKSKKWKKRKKKKNIKIDRRETRHVDKNSLPKDAEFKGYRGVVVQNIKIKTHNVEYKLEQYYSPSEGKLYEGELPKSVHGEFGAELKAFVNALYYGCRVPENKILKFLTGQGIKISAGTISNILTKEKQEKFSKEKNDILKAGMKSTNFFHTDDTGGRHKGMNYHVHTICTTKFGVFFVRPKKDRKTIRETLGLDDDEQIDKIMISDDAKQFLLVAILHALCWLHEIRLYKKMNPILKYYRNSLERFLSKIWDFYDMLKEYKKDPSEQQKLFLEKKFDDIFSTKTGYKKLDERIALTKEKKDRLLLVLEHPEIPLHNNSAERALREFVIKRKVSYGTRSENGRIAWENMMSILDTCRKHDVSFLDYVSDVFSGEGTMPRLANLIMQETTA